MFTSHKDLGLVGEVFSSEVLDRLPRGTMAVGHTRCVFEYIYFFERKLSEKSLAAGSP